MDDFDDGDGDVHEPTFVRALYSYQGTDPSALAFNKGDVIEVFTRLETGWWDGVLNDERGWFPSNYVTSLTQEEIEAYLSNFVDQPPEPQPHESWQTESVVWASDRRRAAHDSLPVSIDNRQSMADDFWMPQVSADGQISYRNSKTGEESREIPSGANSVVDSAVELDEVVNRGTPSSYDLLNSITTDGTNEASRTKLWVKRLADDGLSNYWYHSVTREVRWSEPAEYAVPYGASASSPEDNEEVEHRTLRNKLPGNVFAHSETAEDVLRRLSVYSDSSEVQDIYDAPTTSFLPIQPVPEDEESSNVDDSAPSAEEVAESNAKELQSKLAPSAPEALSSFSITAREALHRVIETAQVDPITASSSSTHIAKVANGVAQVMPAVLNLLYVSGTLAAPVSSLLPQAGEAAESVRSPMIELKPAQRKVTATLSKLSLSSRVLVMNSLSASASAGARVDQDAAELDRAVYNFVSELQQRTAVQSRKKTLYGALDSVSGIGGVGLGHYGGGIGGHAKALGFVSSDDAAERQGLGRNLSHEMDIFCSKVEHRLGSLEQVASSERGDRNSIQDLGYLTITELSTFLAFVEDVDVASYIDVRVFPGNTENYAASARKARLLIRELETSKQAIFDEGLLLLLICQGTPVESLTQRVPSLADHVPSFFMNRLIFSLRSHVRRCHRIIGDLVTIAELQVTLRQNSSAAKPPRPLRDRTIATASPIPIASPSRSASPYVPRGDIRYTAPVTPSSMLEDDFVDMEDAFRTPTASETTFAPSVDSRMGLDPGKPRRFDAGGMANTYDSRPSTSATMNAPSTAASSRPDTPDAEDDDEFMPRPTKTPPRSTKIRKILGEEAPESVLPPEPKKADSTPWYMNPTYGEADILLSPDGSVRGGTIQALVERLTFPTLDNVYFQTFMLTFKSFTSIDELFNLLVARFEIQAPADMTPNERDDWTNRIQTVVRLRVINAIKSIVQGDDIIGPEDSHVMPKIMEFLSTTESIFNPSKVLLKQLRSSGMNLSRKIIPNGLSPSTPQPIQPKVGNRKLKLLDLDPTEMARQLTIKEGDLFAKIRAVDCLARAKEAQGEDDSIRSIISMSNKIADWVNDAVLAKEDVRKRALIIKHFILTAERCRAMNNFSTMAALVAALNSTPIRRLKRTWEQVSQRNHNILDDIEKTLQAGKNLVEYRAMLSKVSLPCVPFIGVYLTTLTFVQDGMKDNLAKEGNLINFSKRQKAAEIIEEIQRYQSQKYNLAPVESIQAFIDEALSLEKSSDYFWDLSVKREPKERDDEKMARLLQESGFL